LKPFPISYHKIKGNSRKKTAFRGENEGSGIPFSRIAAMGKIGAKIILEIVFFISAAQQ
jgi:hypothetical protein